jgi:hypothetical protein
VAAKLKIEKRGDEIKKKSSLLKILSQSHFVSLFLLNLDDQKGRKQYLFLYSQLQWKKND